VQRPGARGHRPHGVPARPRLRGVEHAGRSAPATGRGDYWVEAPTAPSGALNCGVARGRAMGRWGRAEGGAKCAGAADCWDPVGTVSATARLGARWRPRSASFFAVVPWGSSSTRKTWGRLCTSTSPSGPSVTRRQSPSDSFSSSSNTMSGRCRTRSGRGFLGISPRIGAVRSCEFSVRLRLVRMPEVIRPGAGACGAPFQADLADQLDERPVEFHTGHRASPDPTQGPHSSPSRPRSGGGSTEGHSRPSRPRPGRAMRSPGPLECKGTGQARVARWSAAVPAVAAVVGG